MPTSSAPSSAASCARPPAEVLLRGVLLGMSVVAATTGVSVAARGAGAIPGGAPGAPSNDSVMRFYAVWWAAQGPSLWRLSRRSTVSRNELDAVCLTTFLGGLARLASYRQAGAPHPLFRALTVGELVLPPALMLLRRQLPD
jgi:hypothetical protein